VYPPIEIARFTVAEFKRGLEGLTEGEGQTRFEKQGGDRMNAISWSMAHIAGHWLSRPQRLKSFSFQSEDPVPPTLEQANAWLDEAASYTEGWLANADDELLFSKPNHLHGLSVGTSVVRMALHSWFHCGEINAIRQLLGHEEIFFLGDITEHLEWRPSDTLGGYLPQELVRFTIAEYDRGLEGMTDEEAIVKLPKADGTTMNSITWTMGHVTTGWLFASALLTSEHIDFGDRMFFGAGADPTPPSMAEMLEMWERAKGLSEKWLLGLTSELLGSKRDFGPMQDENLGTQLMRAVLHTWFHIGEINAIRQMLGQDEISFVGEMRGRLEYGGAA